MNKVENASLTPIEWAILDRYSKGETYEQIQEYIFHNHGVDLENEKLGYKMGAIKRKTGCTTQFEMGYLYAQITCNQKIKELRVEYLKKINEVSRREFKRGVDTMTQNIDKMLEKRDKQGFRHEGAVMIAFIIILILAISILGYLVFS